MILDIQQPYGHEHAGHQSEVVTEENYDLMQDFFAKKLGEGYTAVATGSDGAKEIVRELPPIEQATKILMIMPLVGG